MRRENVPQLNSWLPKVKAPIEAHLSRFVRGLAAGRGRFAPEAWASAVAVTYGGRPMLLTAKHVLERLDGRHLLLELPDRFESVRLGPAALAENSEADSAVIVLPAAALQWGIEFLVLDAQEEASLSDGDREIFVAMGFPVREAEQSMEQAKLGFGLVTHWSFEHPTAYRRLGLSSQTFLTTTFDRKNAFQAGMIRAMKKPEGMSGGALWRLWGPATQPPSLARGALAGILTRYEVSPVKCMVSTRLAVLHKLAAEHLASESPPPGSSRSDLTRA